MENIKTTPSAHSVADFIAAQPDARREDCHRLIALIQQATQLPPRMWGASIVGFGDYHYRYESGREGDWFVVGFASRKEALTLYTASNWANHPALMDSLGKYKTGKGCLYIKKLADVDEAVLTQLLAACAADIAAAK